ncbi:hypothetical protein IU438_28685 [Nocardia cyriacigeorgica]|uniref:hypothetical protein n=1 Tax=Nocardia cyriacigeorgica TaxID=135487 RepID=UPI0018947017|nr:hypothetical protein [Nocardia cyriacigeorgica]MBF6399749.1 hypothetical protein [Nocardia cyriacigeorgica]MBF6405422.1 hypothetical protein [Nocardia cyriacigeorgica]
MTPAELADWLTQQTADAAARAFERYPNDRTERLADHAASLAMLIEVTAAQLREMGGAR